MNDLALRPKTLDEAMKLADTIAKSDIIPTEYRGKPGNIVIAAMLGSELGMGTLQAMQSICVINGKPTIYGDGALGLVQASGLLEEFSETWDARTETATCRGKRRGNAVEIVRTFSMADANRIEVWEKDRDGNPKRVKLAQKKGPWSDGYAPRMCQMRARGFLLRDGWADVLKGISIREEVEDYETIATAANGGEIQIPRRASEVQKPNGAAEQPAAPVPTPPVAHADQKSETITYATEREMNRLRAVMRGSGRKETDLIDFLGQHGVTDPKLVPAAIFEEAVEWAKKI